MYSFEINVKLFSFVKKSIGIVEEGKSAPSVYPVRANNIYILLIAKITKSIPYPVNINRPSSVQIPKYRKIPFPKILFDLIQVNVSQPRHLFDSPSVHRVSICLWGVGNRASLSIISTS